MDRKTPATLDAIIATFAAAPAAKHRNDLSSARGSEFADVGSVLPASDSRELSPAYQSAAPERRITGKGMGRDVRIDPALKALVDRVLVPAMVRQYRAARPEVRDNSDSRFPSLDSGTSAEDSVQ